MGWIVGGFFSAAALPAEQHAFRKFAQAKAMLINAWLICWWFLIWQAADGAAGLLRLLAYLQPDSTLAPVLIDASQYVATRRIIGLLFASAFGFVATFFYELAISQFLARKILKPAGADHLKFMIQD